MNPTTMHAFSEELSKLAGGKCDRCSSPATKKVLWAEGRAYIPACDSHLDAVVSKVTKLNHDKPDGIKKMSSFMTNLGTRVARNAHKIRGSGTVQGIGKDLKETGKGFLSPVRGIKRGWEDGGWTMAGDGGVQLRAAQMDAGKYDRWMARYGKMLPGGKTWTVAGGAMTAPDAFAEEDSTGLGRSRGKRISGWVGGNVGGLIGAPFGFTGAVAGGLMGEVAGNTIHGVASKAKKLTQRPKVDAPQGGTR